MPGDKGEGGVGGPSGTAAAAVVVPPPGGAGGSELGAEPAAEKDAPASDDKPVTDAPCWSPVSDDMLAGESF